ncbi:glycosyltransferase family 39 protein [Emticicia sp. BO119]|uniref:glycosyltransferase family 39 protein n=1 Tax=Emticicia sp. BO119 TaxID=2757768 RepID=UPI0015F00138|nr:glycosyltransferase family 39 protein [Emticicia sp. BO119]MBA4852559.1 glycosyltransferase family 39 protein [Emticicia sp. BO119]
MASLGKLSTYILLASILVLAFFLRFYNIGAHGLAGDEKYSLFVSQFVSYEGNNQRNSVRKPDSPYFTPQEFWSEKNIHDFFDSIARLDTGNGSLYTYTLHYWSKIFGLDDANLRILSLLFNLLTIFLIFVFVKTHFQSEKLALLATFLSAISPFYINYSQVARNYAMLFFFALLATHLLLLIIQREKNKQKTTLYYLCYGLSALACELCHISTFPLFVIHGLYVLLYVRQLRVWIGLSLAMMIPVAGIITWLKSAGGQWLFDYVQNSVKVYNYLAQTSPDEYLSVATLPNIFKQLRHVISSAFISSEGLYLHLSGFKNTLIAIASPIIGLICFKRISSDRWKIAAITVLIALSLLLYSTAKFQFLVLSLNVVLIGILLNYVVKNFKKPDNPLVIFLLLLVIMPFVFLIIFSLQDGNTFRIIPRYIGYSYAFGIILMTLLIRHIWQMQSKVKYVLFLLLSLQLYLIVGIISSIWQDNPPRYFMNFPEPRQKNPYTLAAEKIQNLYTKGDTVIYCSYKDSMPGAQGAPIYSVVDAQLTNFYLPKESQIIQRVNPAERDKIILKKPDGKEILIFDLQGTKYRY